MLILRGRIGFLVDAAVLGFAVGTGFAIVENVTYLRDYGDAPMMLWALRGLGTGILHGAATAVAAILAKTVADLYPRVLPLTAGPGMAAAIVIHSAYNHLLVFPVLAPMIVLIALPIIVATVFERSEQATREWVGAGLDLDLTLLELVMSDGFQHTRFGVYLGKLRGRFSGPVIADMFCLLRVELELAVQAKARMIAQAAGLELPVDEDVLAALSERSYLQRSIGRTGLRALEPLRVTSHRDYWHQHVLTTAGTRVSLKDRWRRWFGD